MTLDYDLAICGAGPVGLALAALLVEHGIPVQRLAVIDAKTIDAAMHDPRSIALSYGSRQILEKVNAWPASVNPIKQIHVSRRQHFGRTLIDCEEYGLPALGYVTRYGALITALNATAERLGVVMQRPLILSGSVEQANHVELQFADGKKLTAGILVQAEGGVFSEQNSKSINRSYDQTALIAHVEVSTPLPFRAFERFTNEGPLALLPQDNGYALVWCTSPNRAEQLLTLEDTVFLNELQHAFGTRLGKFTRITPRAAYPLGLNARPGASPRSIAIGNAAQTLHPVAGQGLNLGLRDAAVLAPLLARECTPAMLERFLSSRNTDRSLTIQLTDTMARIFASASDGALSQALLGLGLGLIDVFPPAKQLLAEQMMFGRR
jgi:2-octaprenyl-6-methoxyphenol hydroxylase